MIIRTHVLFLIMLFSYSVAIAMEQQVETVNPVYGKQQELEAKMKALQAKNVVKKAKKSALAALATARTIYSDRLKAEHVKHVEEQKKVNPQYTVSAEQMLKNQRAYNENILVNSDGPHNRQLGYNEYWTNKTQNSYVLTPNDYVAMFAEQPLRETCGIGRAPRIVLKARSNNNNA